MLKRVVIENYRSCLRTSIDLHPNLSVLIGPNGSGKTNVLQGIMLLYQMARGPEHAPGLRRLTTKSRIKATFQAGRANADLRASIDTYTNETNSDVILSADQKWLFTRSNGGLRRHSIELPLLGPNRYFPNRYFPNVGLHRYLLHGRTSRLWRVPNRLGKFPEWARRVFERFAKCCLGIRYYGASQFTNPGTCPAAFEIEREDEHRSLHRIRGHARILYGMYSASRAASSHNYTQFIEIVGPKGLRLIDGLTFSEVRSSSTEYTVRVGGKVERRKRENLLIVPQFRIGSQTLSPNQLSEGTFKTLALLFHIITETSSVLLIEEPEVCVHQGLLSSILELIKSYSHQKQMILSTHSDFVLDNVNPENVYRVTLTKAQGTTVRPIRKTMTAREFTALHEYLEKQGNLGEYWREGGLGDRQ